MILIDSNLLIYAINSEFDQHIRAREWLNGVLSEPSRVGLPWISLLAFARLVTNPRLFGQPLSLAEAWRRVEEWLDVSVVWIPEPGERHRDIVRGLLKTPGINSNDVSDVHLAALAIEHGLILFTSDTGFARFQDLRWKNPIAA